jgi:regulator of chromosome condensation
LFLLSDGSVWACGRADGFELGIGQDHPEWKRLQERIAEAKAEILEDQRAARRKSRHDKPDVDAMDEDEVEDGADADTAQRGKKKFVVDEYIPYPVPLLFPPPPNRKDNDPPVEPYTPLASQSAVAQGIKQVACGLHFSLALGEGGQVYSWGYGPSCELGRGDDKPSAVPGRVWSKELDARQVVLDDGSVERGKWNVEGVHAGGQHCLLIVRWESEG